jgi:hypothetical protein
MARYYLLFTCIQDFSVREVEITEESYNSIVEQIKSQLGTIVFEMIDLPGEPVSMTLCAYANVKPEKREKGASRPFLGLSMN